MSSTPKEKKFNAVYESVLTILNSHHGLHGVNHTSLSRVSGVSRPWIYKYLGKSREEVIKKTTEFYIKELMQARKISVIETVSELKEQIRESTIHFLQQAQRHPKVIPLIFVYFESLGPVGVVVRESFKAYSGKLSKDIQRVLKTSKSDAEVMAELVSIMRLGLAFFLVRGEKSKVTGALNIIDLQRVYSQFKELL